MKPWYCGAGLELGMLVQTHRFQYIRYILNTQIRGARGDKRPGNSDTPFQLLAQCGSRDRYPSSYVHTWHSDLASKQGMRTFTARNEDFHYKE